MNKFSIIQTFDQYRVVYTYKIYPIFQMDDNNIIRHQLKFIKAFQFASQ